MPPRRPKQPHHGLSKNDLKSLKLVKTGGPALTKARSAKVCTLSSLIEPQKLTTALQTLEREIKQRKKRFTSPTIRGVAYGTKNVDIEEEEFDARQPDGSLVRRTRRAIQGSVTVWASISVAGEIHYRIWPQGFSGPWRYTSKKEIQTASYTPESLRAALLKRHRVCRALEQAELNYAVPGAKFKISKAEAVLASTIKESWLVAQTYMISGGPLFDLYSAEEWDNDEQAAGMALFKRLQQKYGPYFFPSPEAVSVAAEWLLEKE